MPDAPSRARDDRAAVDKAISVLRAFGGEASTGIGVSELARRARLSKSTAFRLLGMLERDGAVERAGSAYRLGPVIRELGGQAAAPGHDRLSELLAPHLADLYVATHLTVQLGLLQGGEVVYLNKLEGHHRLRTPARIGGRMPAYCTAVGKVLLAHDTDAAQQTLGRPRHAWTTRTITDADMLSDELCRVRRTGIALDRGETLNSLDCIAAAVRGPGGTPVAAMSVSWDAATLDPERVERTLRQICFHASRTVTAALSRTQDAPRASA